MRSRSPTPCPNLPDVRQIKSHSGEYLGLRRIVELRDIMATALLVRLELQEDIPFDRGDDIGDIFIEPLHIALGKPGLICSNIKEEDDGNENRSDKR